MIAIEVTHLNVSRVLLERAVREERARTDLRDISRTVELLYGAVPTASDLGTVARVAAWIDRNPLEPAGTPRRADRGDVAVLQFLNALTRYLPDRIVISHRNEVPWFAFELPQTVLSVGSIPRIPPPFQWYIHTDPVHAILKTFSSAPTLDDVREEAHVWLRSEAYRIKLAAGYRP